MDFFLSFSNLRGYSLKQSHYAPTEPPFFFLFHCVSFTYSLSLHSAQHDTLHEVALQERIDTNDRSNNQHGRRGDDRIRRKVVRRLIRHTAHRDFCLILQSRGVRGQAAQEVLQGNQALGATVDHVVKPGVPVSNHLPQTDRSQNRHGQRQDDLVHDLQHARAVKRSGFFQRTVDGQEVVADDDGIIHAEAARQHIHPEIIHQTQLLDIQERRDQTAGEEHRKQEDQRQRLAERHFLAHQRKRRQAANHQMINRAHHSAQDGVDQRHAHQLVLEAVCVSVKAPGLGPQVRVDDGNIRRQGEGRDHHIPHRENDRNAEQQDEQIVDDIKQVASERFVNVMMAFFRQLHFSFASLHDPVVRVSLLGKPVTRHDQSEADDILEQTDGSRVIVLGIEHAAAIHIGGNDVCHLIGAFIVQVENRVKAYADNAAQSQDQHRRNRRQNARERDMHDLLESARAVDDGGFIQRGIDARDGSQIDDNAPAQFLPCRSNQVNGIKHVALNHEVNRLIQNAQLKQNRIDDAVAGREQLIHKSAHNNPGEEVRQVGDRLRDTLKLVISHFVHQQRENDRQREDEQKIQEAQAQRVLQHPVKRRVIEHLLEMLQAHPGAAHDAALHFEVFKGDLDTVNRQIVKYDHLNQRQNEH